MTLETVELSYGATSIRGWNDFTFTRAIDSLANGFSCQTTTQNSLPTPTTDVVRVTTNGDLLTTGFVEKYGVSGSRNGGTKLRLTGRSKAGVLLDSNAALSLTDVDTFTVIRKLAELFGVDVVVGPGVSTTQWLPQATFMSDIGQRVGDQIHGLLQVQQVWATSNADGAIELTKAGSTSQGSIATGQTRVTDFAFDVDQTADFARFVAVGQEPYRFAGVPATVIGDAVESVSAIPLRTRTIFPTATPTTEAERNAAFRAAQRGISDAFTMRLDVVGWRAQDGTLFQPGSQLRVELTGLAQVFDLIIHSVTFNQSRRAGTTANLTLKRPEGFTPDASATPVGMVPTRARTRAPVPVFNPFDGGFNAR